MHTISSIFRLFTEHFFLLVHLLQRMYYVDSYHFDHTLPLCRCLYGSDPRIFKDFSKDISVFWLCVYIVYTHTTLILWCKYRFRQCYVNRPIFSFYFPLDLAFVSSTLPADESTFSLDSVLLFSDAFNILCVISFPK